MGKFTGEYVPLNVEQARVIRLVRPHEGERGFFARLTSGELDLGHSPMRVLSTMQEVAELGGLQIVGDGDERFFVLGSAVRAYEAETLARLLRSAWSLAVKLVCGASGGLVVWVLTRMAGA